MRPSKVWVGVADRASSACRPYLWCLPLLLPLLTPLGLTNQMRPTLQ